MRHRITTLAGGGRNINGVCSSVGGRTRFIKTRRNHLLILTRSLDRVLVTKAHVRSLSYGKTRRDQAAVPPHKHTPKKTQCVCRRPAGLSPVRTIPGTDGIPTHFTEPPRPAVTPALCAPPVPLLKKPVKETSPLGDPRCQPHCLSFPQITAACGSPEGSSIVPILMSKEARRGNPLVTCSVPPGLRLLQPARRPSPLSPSPPQTHGASGVHAGLAHPAFSSEAQACLCSP